MFISLKHLLLNNSIFLRIFRSNMETEPILEESEKSGIFKI
jgi:hypothetical protein